MEAPVSGGNIYTEYFLQRELNLLTNDDSPLN